MAKHFRPPPAFSEPHKMNHIIFLLYIQSLFVNWIFLSDIETCLSFFHLKKPTTKKSSPNLHPPSAPTHSFNSPLSPSGISISLPSSRPPAPTAYLMPPLRCHVHNGTHGLLPVFLPSRCGLQELPRTECHHSNGSSQRPRRDLGFPPLSNPPCLVQPLTLFPTATTIVCEWLSK